MIGMTNAMGGKDRLRYRVYGGTTPPASPREYDFYVKTTTPITQYELNYWTNTQPTWQVVDGNVYIVSKPWADGSQINLSKDPMIALLFDPQYCFQQINGQWYQMEAYVYKSGKWVQFSTWAAPWDGYLYKLGNNQYTSITGGWSGGTYNSEGTLDFTASGSPDSVIRTNNKIDLTNFKTLVFEGIMWGNNSGGSWGGNMVVCGGADGSSVVAQKNIGTIAWGTYTLDISSVKGSYYVRFQVGGNDHSIRMRNCYLQK